MTSRLLKQAAAVHNTTALPATLKALLGTFTAVPDAQLAELAALLTRAEQSPYTVASVNALIDALNNRVSYQPVLDLIMEQGGQTVQRVLAQAGPVSITAVVSNFDAGITLSYSWSESSDAMLQAASSPNPLGPTISFEPAALAESPITARVIVGHSSGTSSAKLPVHFAKAGTAPSSLIDRDSDGIADVFDGSLESSTHPNTAHLLQSISGNDSRYLLETDPSMALRMGSLVRSANLQQGSLKYDILLTIEPSAATTDPLFLPTAWVYDFSISQLPHAGSNAELIIPLREPLPTQAVYRKYHAHSGWRAFVEDGLNSVASAATVGGVAGLCPALNSASYKPGLTAGDTCLRLKIEDGGPNDNDRLNTDGSLSVDRGINGRIADPGSIMQAKSKALETPRRTVKGGSMGFLGLSGLLLLSLRLYPTSYKTRKL